MTHNRLHRWFAVLSKLFLTLASANVRKVSRLVLLVRHGLHMTPMGDVNSQEVEAALLERAVESRHSADAAAYFRTMLVSEQLTRASPVGRLLSLRVLPPCWCLSRSTRTPARPTTRVTLLMRRRCPDASLFWRRDLCRMLPLAVEMVRPFRTKSVPPATPTRQRPYHSSNFGLPEKEQRGGGGGEKRR
jgi:hypothetical protein